MSGPLTRPGLLTFFLSVMVPVGAWGADEAPARRGRESREFHLRAQERCGVLVPMYLYPADIHKNPAYNRLMDVRRRHESVPM